ncbi:MAG TPA: hypothetical protein VGS20_08755 [Candidatus Acidoferrales bacterium]|nr:hypothetical protein [Candidatus Acidoferrales bacterium]
MSKLFSASLVVAFLAIARASAPQDRATGACDGLRLIPLTIPSNLKLKVVNHWLMFAPYVEGALVLRNETGQTISDIAVLVNYEDKQGRPLFTITYQASVKDSEHSMSDVRPFFRGLLTTAVRPGETFDLFGTALLETTTVPARAAVSGANLRLSDVGMVFTVAWAPRSDPILEEVPRGDPDLGTPPLNLPDDVVLKLSLAARGGVEHVGFASETASSDPLVTAATDEIKRWRFYPAIYNGFGVPSELSLLLRFRRGDEPPVRDCFLGQGDKFPNTFAIVTFKAYPNAPLRWQCFYGGFNAYGWGGPFLGQQAMEITPRGTKSP